MSIVVKKFGGACFEDLNGYVRIASSIRRSDSPQALVVSARKGITDELTSHTATLGGLPGSQLSDLMLMTGELQSAILMTLALRAIGVDADFIPAEKVFETDALWGDASITHVHTNIVREALDRGAVPVVPGFYGAGKNGAAVTLGRGGSDYSAVALAIALKASHVELCKAEVDGIFDRNPHTTTGARRYDELTHEQALMIARNGGKVLQVKSARLALEQHMPILVRPAFNEGPGTRIGFDRLAHDFRPPVDFGHWQLRQT